MVVQATTSFRHRLTDANECHHSIVAVNHSFPDRSLSYASPHNDNGLSGLFPSQHKLKALTPVYASSLYWLI